MPRFVRFMPLALLCIAALAPPAAAQAPELLGQPVGDETRFTVDKYLDYETVASPQISPDGAEIIYTRRWVNKQDDRWESALWIMQADGSRNRFLTEGSGAVWSPDGERIAYLAEGEPEGAQLWVRWMDEPGPGTQITRLTESPGNIAWSPDGERLGFTMFVPDEPEWTIDMPSPPEGASWTEAPRFIERLHYRQDRQGFSESGFVHLFTVSAEGGMPREVTTGEWNVGARFDQLAGGAGWVWMPDGRTIVFEGLQLPPDSADLTYRDSYLYTVDTENGTIRQLTPERGSWNSPAVSPNGRWIAFTGQPYSTMSYRADALYVMEADGSGMRRIAPDLDRAPASVQWAPDNSGVYFTYGDRGTSNVHFASVRGGVRTVTEGTHMLSLGPTTDGRVAAGVRTSYHDPGDVVRIDLRGGGITQLTSVNADLLDGIKLGEVEEIWYTSSDSTRVQGWIVRPPAFDSTRAYPLILEIHGGPHAMYNVGFNPMFQNFAANGYVVLYTNPRGSTGYGTAFGNAIERAYPSVDYEDLMAGVDAVLARGYIDPERMYVGGCSGGGVLSSWVIGHTDRFAAAAVRCPVINWLSFAGHTDVPLFTYNFFDEPFWEDPEPWLEQSPLMYVGEVETPTLLMTGILDLRTPMAQTEEYYAALKMRGVPSALLRFHDEYHGTGSNPSNWMRTQLYMMSWYGQWDREEAEARTAGATGSR